MVERLLDAGLRVLALHPNQVAAARDRFRVSGGKSDGFDAFVLCELARTDHHRFRVLEPDSDATKAIRALTRGREDLVGARTALVNQLRAELERFWPGPLGLFTSAQPDLARVPRALPEPRGRARARRAAHSGVPGPPALLRGPEARASFWRSSGARPTGRVGELSSPSAGSSCAPSSRRSRRSTRRSSSSSGGSPPPSASIPTAPIFLSLFRARVITAAELLAEIGDCRGRYPTRDALAGDAGQAAVAIESGKRKAACFRWGCNKRLRRRSARWRTAAATGTPGRRPLRRRPRPRPRPPARAAHRRPRLVSHRVALLARSHPI